MQFINFLEALPLCYLHCYLTVKTEVQPARGLLSLTDEQTDITTGLHIAYFVYIGGRTETKQT